MFASICSSALLPGTEGRCQVVPGSEEKAADDLMVECSPEGGPRRGLLGGYVIPAVVRAFSRLMGARSHSRPHALQMW
ncbi:hypothetical protein GCM10027519_29680 [Kineococcus endophyticus]